MSHRFSDGNLYIYASMRLIEEYRGSKIDDERLICYDIEGEEPVILVYLRERKDPENKAGGYTESEYLIDTRETEGYRKIRVVEIDVPREDDEVKDRYFPLYG